MKVTEFQLRLELGGFTDNCQVVHVCMLEVQRSDITRVIAHYNVRYIRVVKTQL